MGREGLPGDLPNTCSRGLRQQSNEVANAQRPGGASIAYSAIPNIAALQEPLRTHVRDAFAGSIAVIWQVMIGIAGAGLLSSIAMKNVQMGSKVDEKWGMEKGEKKSSGEA